MRTWLSGLSFALALTSVSSVHAAGPSHGIPAMLADQRFRMGQSVGSPTEGHLVGGSHLEPAPYLRILPAYSSEDARWGLGSLVAMIDHSAHAVHRQFPDAVLSVGHLSLRGGGDIDRHASHESGRDADLSFYIRGQTNHPLYSDHMVAFRGDGTAPSWPGAFFDDAKNWALVSAILQQPSVHVTYIFVAAPLRARLLAYAAKVGAPLAIRNLAAELLVQPHGSLPHDDHFHVRIGCPGGMNACIELPRVKQTRMLAHHGRPSPAHVVASAKVTPPPHVVAHTKAHVVDPVAPVPDHATPVDPPDAPPPPTSAAVLVTPFDDVDGPVSPGLTPRHLDIQ